MRHKSSFETREDALLRMRPRYFRFNFQTAISIVIARSTCDEAIQPLLCRSGLLRFARNDGETQFLILATALVRGLPIRSPPKAKGRRECRVSDAPVVGAKNAPGSATGSPVQHRHSLRNGFTASFALSPVTGLSCHR